MMSDVVPLWLSPTRNALGILGGIPRREFTHDSIEQSRGVRRKLACPCGDHQLHLRRSAVQHQLDQKTLDVPSIHFDSAWVPYTNFHPIYQGKAA
jgi:lysine decarboxylase